MKMFAFAAMAFALIATPVLAQTAAPLVVDRSALVSTDLDQLHDVCGPLAQRKLSLQDSSWDDGLSPDEVNSRLRQEIDDCLPDAEAFAELLQERGVVEIREAS